MKMPEDAEESDNQLSHERSMISDDFRVALWRSVNELAVAWRRLPLFQSFVAALPRNASQRSSGIPGRLQVMQAGGGNISEFPLRLTRAVELMSHISDPFPGVMPPPRQWDLWLRSATQVEAAHRLTVAWLRSRIPRYPIIPAPQLAPGAPLTAIESDFELIWTREERRLGLQLQNPPARIGEALQATPTEQSQLIAGTQAIALALERTDEWARLNAATQALTEASRTELSQARETISSRLGQAEIDAYSLNLIARFNYRVAVLNEVLGTLSSTAHEYANAFASANKLVDTAASDVFGELAAYGPPTTVRLPQDIDLRPGSFQLVSFTRTITEESDRHTALELGQIIWLRDPLIPDAVRLIGSTHSFNDSSARERWTGEILSGTNNAWS